MALQKALSARLLSRFAEMKDGATKRYERQCYEKAAG